MESQNPNKIIEILSEDWSTTVSDDKKRAAILQEENIRLKERIEELENEIERGDDEHDSELENEESEHTQEHGE